jgi:hypothetical protein
VSWTFLTSAAIAAVAVLAGGCAVPAGGATGGAAAGGAAHQAHLQSDASGRGTVTGQLVMEGGPVDPRKPQPRIRPIPGTVRFSRDGRRVASVHVGSSGKFTLALAPGTYAAVGRSPDVLQVSNGAVVGADGHVVSGTARQAACSPPVRVVVTPRHTVAVVIACIVP